MTKLRTVAALSLCTLFAVSACGGDSDSSGGSGGTTSTGGTTNTGGSTNTGGAGTGGAGTGGMGTGGMGTGGMATGGSGGGGGFECEGTTVPVDEDAVFAMVAGDYLVVPMADCSPGWLQGTTYTLTVGANPPSLALTSEGADLSFTWDDMDDYACYGDQLDVTQIRVGDALPFLAITLGSGNTVVVSVNAYDGTNLPCTLGLE